MISELNQTPKAMRLHIGVFGGTNAGKSTLINALCGQEIALTSPVAGTTTDPVFKPMELAPLGAVVFIDTAGLDDVSELGALRREKTLEQLDICDAAIVVVSSLSTDISAAKSAVALIKERKLPLLLVVNLIEGKASSASFEDLKAATVAIDLAEGSVLPIKIALIELLEGKEKPPPLTSDLVKSGDMVILVMPQDTGAPKGRLILPQVQVLRDLLDNSCMALSVTAENLGAALSLLKAPPDLVITDSQVFKAVDAILPREVRLTSFSILMAKVKSDIAGLIEGASAISALKGGDRVMIVESCSHHEMDGDIARVKLPAMLKKFTGKALDIVNHSGQALPEGIESCALVIHCGGCMVNRMAMLSKQEKLAAQGIPMTNFGIAIAYMNGILGRCVY